MGYNAFVACNCYRQQLTAAPPYPELVAIDEDGSVYLEFPAGLWKQDQALYLRIDSEFDDWQAHACAHPGMCAADERLANMSGMAAFRRIMQERGGADRFPTLAEHLPRSNNGNLPAMHAPALLRELAALAAEPAEGLAVLREQASGELIYSVNSDSQAIFMFVTTRYCYGLDQEGFFITEKRKSWFKRREEHLLRFRARHFRQECLADKRYRFTDLGSGHQYKCVAGLRVAEAEPAPAATFSVAPEIAPLAREYEYILAPLGRLAEAALQTGNPICWV
jgi:hypothetical protein